MQLVLSWILASASALLLASAGLLWWIERRRRPAATLPTEWALAARPVFSADERRVYRLLREALPHHVLLAKLPLVRLCQPTDPTRVRYWYDLLGSIHVAFAVCSPNGRVLAAIDLDHERGNSRRVMHIKQSVLAACRVRYLRCPVDHLPTVPELQLLVPQGVAPSRGPQPAPAGGAAAAVGPGRRRERTPLWRESGFFQDSFFGSGERDSPTEPGAFASWSPTSAWPTPDGPPTDDGDRRTAR